MTSEAFPKANQQSFDRDKNKIYDSRRVVNQRNANWEFADVWQLNNARNGAKNYEVEAR